VVATHKICAVVPAYDEERSVGRIVRELRQLVPAIEVIVVNDGSRDNTEMEACAAGAHVLSLPKNRGYGAALQTGIRHAFAQGAEFVVTLDADGQHDPAEIPLLLAPVLDGEADLALGSRYLGRSAGYRVPHLRRAGSWFFARIASALVKQPITDPTTGFQAMNRKVLASYAGWSRFPVRTPDANLLLYASRRGHRIVERPVIMHADEGPGSMHGTLRSAVYPVQMLSSILAVLLRRR
jgi:glycosyltransferase involved in cell wall biosynthesis